MPGELMEDLQNPYLFGERPAGEYEYGENDYGGLTASVISGGAQPDGRYASGPRPSRTSPVRRPALRGSAPSIPWNLVIPLLLAAAAAALLVIYRQAIIQFFANILSLVVVLAVVLCILKLILFGRK